MDNLDYCGIDVGSRTLETAVERDGKVKTRTFLNTPAGHVKLRKFLEMRKGRRVRVVLESTGVYGLDLAILLSKSERVEVSEANPRAVRRFAEASMKRGKTDSLDAAVLLEYAKRMEFRPYTQPSENAMSLRCITRRIRGLSEMRVKEMNRLHAATSTATTPAAVIESLKRSIARIADEIEELKFAATQLIGDDEVLGRKFDLLKTVRGVAVMSGLQILGELACLPADLDARQMVAMAGLDPVELHSGTSVKVKKGISKQGNRLLRAALFMPARVGARCDPHIRGYFEHLVGRGKKKSVATTAVMRKLLHSIHGMLKNNEEFDGTKFHKLPDPVT